MELHREDVTLLDRAKIQSEVVVPLIRALEREIGAARAHAIVRDSVVGGISSDGAPMGRRGRRRPDGGIRAVRRLLERRRSLRFPLFVRADRVALRASAQPAEAHEPAHVSDCPPRCCEGADDDRGDARTPEALRMTAEIRRPLPVVTPQRVLLDRRQGRRAPLLPLQQLRRAVAPARARLPVLPVPRPRDQGRVRARDRRRRDRQRAPVGTASRPTPTRSARRHRGRPPRPARLQHPRRPSPYDVHVGDRVKVVFEREGRRRPSRCSSSTAATVRRRPAERRDPPTDHARFIRPMASSNKFEDRVAITRHRDLRRRPAADATRARRSRSTRSRPRSPTPGSSSPTSTVCRAIPAPTSPGMAEGGISAVEDALGIRADLVQRRHGDVRARRAR